MRVRLAIALRLLGGPAASAEDAAWPEPPFDAEVALSSVYARARPDWSATPVGLLEEGNRVEVTGCVPACDREGWAILGGDGAVRLRLLRPAVGPPRAPDRLIHGTVRRGNAPVHAMPDAGSEILREEPEGWVIAFVHRPYVQARGWLQRPSGGFVPAGRVRLPRSSAFAGERSPDLPLAFVVREVELAQEEGGPAGWRVPRYARLPVLGLEGQTRVRIEGGLLPRAAVRLALAKPRPEPVRPGDRWVNVDLSEQALTAYEGDLPVFATLVSTGARGRGTAPGLYQVMLKLRSGDMQSERWGYHLEDVPHLLYFRGNNALHAAFWHDAFGTPVTHGCVNLSPADAAWMFEWAPPPLPRGWQGIMPLAAGKDTLWVQVEGAIAPEQDGAPAPGR